MEPLFVTVLFYAYCMSVCESGRQLSNLFIKDYEMQLLLTEFFGTMQICVVLFEARITFMDYGAHAYAVSLFTLVVVHCLTLRTAHGSPCAYLYMYRAQLTGAMFFLSMVASQIAGGYLSFHMARYFWSFNLSATHHHLFTSSLSQKDCHSSLHVSWLPGMMAEATATGINRLITLLALSKLPRLWPVIVALTWAVLVTLGLNVTGCYQNPMLASALNLRCDLDKLGTHFGVYWAGPSIGFVLASHIYFYRFHVFAMWFEHWRSFVNGLFEPLIEFDQKVSDMRSSMFGGRQRVGDYGSYVPLLTDEQVSCVGSVPSTSTAAAHYADAAISNPFASKHVQPERALRSESLCLEDFVDADNEDVLLNLNSKREYRDHTDDESEM